MNSQIETKTLKTACKRLAAFISTRPSLPILHNVHVTVHYGCLRMTVYDMEKSLTIKLAIDNARTCSIAVKFHDLRKIVDKIKRDSIQLDFGSDTELKIKAGNIDFNIKAKPGSDFPRMPEAPKIDATTNTTWESFVSEANFTKAASSIDAVKNYTSGILFDYQDGKLAIVGTDGRRLHMTWINGQHHLTSDSAKTHTALVLTTTVHAMSRLKLNPEAQLHINFSENLMHWSVPDDGIKGVTHLLDTPFPEYEKVVPDDCQSRFRLNVPETIETLNAISVVATQDDGRHMVVVNANGTLNLSARSDTMGEASGMVPCNHLAGPETSFALNVHYFTETLKIAGKHNVLMANSGSLEPVRFDYDDTDRIAVVMPVRLPE